MKTSVIEVGGLLSVLSGRGVEKQLANLYREETDHGDL